MGNVCAHCSRFDLRLRCAATKANELDNDNNALFRWGSAVSKHYHGHFTWTWFRLDRYRNDAQRKIVWKWSYLSAERNYWPDIPQAIQCKHILIIRRNDSDYVAIGCKHQNVDWSIPSTKLAHENANTFIMLNTFCPTISECIVCVAGRECVLCVFCAFWTPNQNTHNQFPCALRMCVAAHSALTWTQFTRGIAHTHANTHTHRNTVANIASCQGCPRTEKYKHMYVRMDCKTHRNRRIFSRVERETHKNTHTHFG